jgi:hypothetical protein
LRPRIWREVNGQSMQCSRSRRSSTTLVLCCAALSDHCLGVCDEHTLQRTMQHACIQIAKFERQIAMLQVARPPASFNSCLHLSSDNNLVPSNYCEINIMAVVKRFGLNFSALLYITPAVSFIFLFKVFPAIERGPQRKL